MDDDQVSLSYRNYRDGQHKTLTLDVPEFTRRFLLLVLPKGLMWLRHYGLLGNRCRVQRLAQIREILGATAAARARVGRRPRAQAGLAIPGVSARAHAPGARDPAAPRRHSTARLIADGPSTAGTLSLPTE